MAIWTNVLQLQEANAAGGGRALRAGSLLCSKPTPLCMTHFIPAHAQSPRQSIDLIM